MESIRHNLKWGSRIRGAVIDGQVWFCLGDIAQACNRPYPRRLKEILLFEERRQFVIDGRRHFAVNCSGMLALLHKRHSVLMRRLVLELIRAFPDETEKGNSFGSMPELFSLGICKGGKFRRAPVYRSK